MSATVVAPGATGERSGSGRVDLAIARRAFRQVWIGATVCAVVFGSTAASSALAYATTFPTEASRQAVLAGTSSDAGLAVLMGPVTAVDTVGGYTVYKGFVFLTTIGAIWALLAATRLLRGEEDTGRWQLVLAGGTRPARATSATLAALGLALVVIWLGTSVLVALAGRSPDVHLGAGDSLIYGLSLVVPAAVFAGIGAVASQLCRSRRAASTLAMVTFGVLFALRMASDAGSSTQWMRWLTPFGWSELMAPFTTNDLWPLVPTAVAVVVLVGLAIGLSSRRDVGDGLLAGSDVARLRPFGLGSATGIAARLELPTLTAWVVGTLASGLMLGIIAKVTTSSLPESLGNTLDKFGGHGSFADQYFGVAFLLVGTIVALLPAGQLGAAADEEVSGRLVHVLAGPTTRRAWFAGRLALAAAAVAVAGLAGGVGAWLGAASQGVPTDAVSLVGAGLNLVPTALVALGLGAVVLAVFPRAAATTVYAVVIWSSLADILASMVTSVSWIEKTSLFHYMALAPGQQPEARTLVITTALALVLVVLAVAVFGRRDVQTG